MTYEERRTTVERSPVDPLDPTAPRDLYGRVVPPAQVVEQREASSYTPSGSTVAARVVTVVFGIIQALILVRIVLLGLGAQRSNDFVTAILNASQVFVAPFEGMFRTDALSSGGSVLDIAAITALIAITILELIVLAIVRIPRRTESY
jgi:hypothetical protein